MPKDFLQAVKRGARVRRKTLLGNKYINIAFLHGKSYAGETHKIKKGA